MSKSKEVKKQDRATINYNKDIREKLTHVLAGFKETLGDKEFATRIKKASKLFSRGLEKINKKSKKEKTPAKEIKLIPDQGLVK